MAGESEIIQALLAKAKQARWHAAKLMDDKAATALRRYADELEARAAAVKKKDAAEPAPTLPEQAANAPTGEPAIGPDLVAAMKPPETPEDEVPAP